MSLKILAGFIVAVVVAVGGVYFSTSIKSIMKADDAPSNLPVSEGSSCSKATAGHCCETSETTDPDTLGACMGGTSIGVTAAGPSACAKKTASCCSE